MAGGHGFRPDAALADAPTGRRVPPGQWPGALRCRSSSPLQAHETPGAPVRAARAPDSAWTRQARSPRMRASCCWWSAAAAAGAAHRRQPQHGQRQRPVVKGAVAGGGHPTWRRAAARAPPVLVVRRRRDGRRLRHLHPPTTIETQKRTQVLNIRKKHAGPHAVGEVSAPAITNCDGPEPATCSTVIRSAGPFRHACD